MKKNEKSECAECNVCGMHLCKMCAMPNAIFGLLLIIAGFGLWADAPMWFNGWTLIGLYLALWGLMAMFVKK